MKRVHVLEVEDLSWFPTWLRTCLTNNLIIFARLLGVNAVLGQLVVDALKKAKLTKIVDLGSGSGGPLPEIHKTISGQEGFEHTKLELSDKYPNPKAIEFFNQPTNTNVHYRQQSIDATQLDTVGPGLKTMVNCFHHMRPPQARAILKSAVEHREPILIYEMGGHVTLPFPLWLLGLPVGFTFIFIVGIVTSALVRPVTWKHLFFTYAVPVIPLFFAWDGQASMARMYRNTDLDELLSGLESSDYNWEKGYGRSKRGNKIGTYLLGLPRTNR